MLSVWSRCWHFVYNIIQNAWTDFRSKFPTQNQGDMFVSMFILKQFSKHSPSTCSAKSFGFLSVRLLTNHWLFISNWKWRDTSPNNFDACHITSQPPRAVHWTVRWFGWSTYGAYVVNFDFINIKNSSVLKLKIFTVNELPVNARNLKLAL